MRERVNKAKENEDETPSTSADVERGGSPLVDFSKKQHRGINTIVVPCLNGKGLIFRVPKFSLWSLRRKNIIKRRYLVLIIVFVLSTFCGIDGSKSITRVSDNEIRVRSASPYSSSFLPININNNKKKKYSNIVARPSFKAEKPDTEHRLERRFVQERRIPRIIHQTYWSREGVPDELRKISETWKAMNPGYEYKFYDDKACSDFVEREFPEYFDVYLNLPKNVERSDFFRILVILREGGVYADMDAGCVKPIESFISPMDALVVGWENECATDERAYSRHFARRRQITNWVFAGVPEHPALKEMADHVREHANVQFMNNTNRNTLEKTGPGAFTDAIMRTYWEYYDNEDKNWAIKVLPRVAFGTHPSESDSLDGLSQKEEKNVFVAHYFLGSWKKDWGAYGRDGVFNKINLIAHSVIGNLPEYRESLVKLDPDFIEMQHQDERSHYPVTALFHPPFEVIVGGLVSDDDASNRSDVSNGFFLDDFIHDDFSVSSMSAQLTIRGEYQPGTSLRIRTSPTSVEAVINVLERKLPLRTPLTPYERDPMEEERGLLIDIGANVGYFSLCAAARGHKVLAFSSLTTNSKVSDMLKSSIALNHYGALIEHIDDMYPSFSDAKTACSRLATSVEERDRCGHTAFSTLDDILFFREREGVRKLLLGQRRRVAMRISATCRIARPLAGSLRLLKSPALRPTVLLIELAGSCKAQENEHKGNDFDRKGDLHGEASNLEALIYLNKLNYTEIYHAGPVCDSYGSEAINSVMEDGSTGIWCKVHDADRTFQDLVENDSLENIIFL
jgi:mannosyltransferase OCH1-like enzyme